MAGQQVVYRSESMPHQPVKINSGSSKKRNTQLAFLPQISAVSIPFSNGDPVNGTGDEPNMHDILTGSLLDGTGFSGSEGTTCGNWTSSGRSERCCWCDKF